MTLSIHTDIRRLKIAVVVPVYNAPTVVAPCIQALLRFTHPDVQLIFVDDASTDPAIRRLLGPLEKKRNVLVVHHEVNQGYTRSINEGIRQAGQRDIVLLNSDTEVGPGWLRQLALTANADATTGTVTAISNNAGAFAYPEIEQDNPLPDGVSREQFALLVRQTGGALYPQLPTGNGFCMYIKQAVLQRIGLFDAEAFPRGYGEENDFCMRALRLGWRHIQDDRTWIYHVRSASLGDEVSSLANTGMAVLDARYSDYRMLVESGMNSTRRALASDRMRRLTEAVPAQRYLPRPRVLTIGGESVEQNSASQSVRPGLGNLFQLYRLNADGCRLTLAWQDLKGDDQVRNYDLLDPVDSISHLSHEYDLVVGNWLLKQAVDLVEIQDVYGHGLGLAHVAKRLGLAVLVHLSDYYGVCPTRDLIDEKGQFCGGQCTPDSGKDCSAKSWCGPVSPLKRQFVTRWRKNLRQLYSRADAFVTKSESLAERYRALGLISPAQRVEVVQPERVPALEALYDDLLYPARGESLRVDDDE